MLKNYFSSKLCGPCSKRDRERKRLCVFKKYYKQLTSVYLEVISTEQTVRQ